MLSIRKGKQLIICTPTLAAPQQFGEFLLQIRNSPGYVGVWTVVISLQCMPGTSSMQPTTERAIKSVLNRIIYATWHTIHCLLFLRVPLVLVLVLYESVGRTDGEGRNGWRKG